MSRNLQKYLAHHSALSRLPDPVEVLAAKLPSCDGAVVVPLCGERQLVPELLDSLGRAAEYARHRILVILVVNERSEAVAERKADNADTLLYLQGHSATRAPHSLVLTPIDCTGRNAFAAKEGVGLARKIGGDLACWLYSQGKLNSPWIQTTDGDALVPRSYFLATRGLAEGVAVYGFEHLPFPDAEWNAAIQAYDTFLRYYESGLRFAQSPYAFPTVGSTIAYHAETYASVRGIPNLEAGEDFYFLIKAAKVGPVHRLDQSVVQLRPRESDRVPFGTGAALTEIVGQARTGTQYQIYHPKLFVLLGKWNRAAEAFIATKNPEAIEALLKSHRELQKVAAQFPIAEKLSNFSAQFRSEAALRKAWHDWFDGFKTLKWLHALREDFPDLPLADLGAPQALPKLFEQPENLLRRFATVKRQTARRSDKAPL